jgi:hypothetical protein
VRAIDTLQALRVVARAETEAAAKAILTELEDAATPAAAGASDLSTYTAEVERHIVKLRTLSCDGGSELPDVVATVVHERDARGIDHEAGAAVHAAMAPCLMQPIVGLKGELSEIKRSAALATRSCASMPA